MSTELKFAVTIGGVALSTLLGYGARRLGWLKEDASRPIMTGVMVVGYPVVGFLAIWKIKLVPSDTWLPILGFAQGAIMALLALGLARLAKRPRGDRGLYTLCCTGGNHGITMAGFVVFLIYGEEGLGHSTVYALYTFLSLVFLMYPIGKHFTPDAEKRSLLNLFFSSLFDYRSVGLLTCTVGIILSLCGVERPAIFTDWNIVEICVYSLIVAAYVSIGLRLHLRHVWPMRWMILSVLGTRHILAPMVGGSLLLLTWLTPWPLKGLNANILLIQSSVSMAVMSVGVANMFHIRPREASVMFVISSAFYLAVILPLVCWIFG